MGVEKSMIEEIVKQVLAKQGVASFDDFVKDREPQSGVLSVESSTVKVEKFDTGKEGDQVFLKDVVSLEESPRLGCGVMEMKETTFDWYLKYDEVDVVLEGTLVVIINGKKVVANKGDIIYIPKESAIQFSVPDHARFIYVTYPANWEQL